MDVQVFAAISEEALDAIYRDWQSRADSVPEQWRIFFSGFELGLDEHNSEAKNLDERLALKLSGVQSLIYRYRSVGHLIACTDPLSPCQLFHPLLELSSFGLDEKDLEATFACRRFFKQNIQLREIVETMRESYCREIGIEFMHMQDPDERQWFIDRMEPCRNHPVFSISEKLNILEKLHQATLFESFLHRRFVGQKRFSLEGGEVLIPVLDRIISACAKNAISDVVMGMSHRGRLNVLAHILRKPYETVFSEFRESEPLGFSGDGDVKYHKGHSCDIDVGGHKVHVTIAANPSHLEAVNAVVEGKCRARQDRYGAGGAQRVLPVLIHGDAAFAGQGSVMEVLNMSGLDGYGTGGTIHIVLNNQIGFTTLPRDSRSARYATDAAKILACPVFHVQGEAPESALHAVDLAMAYRSLFGRDVVVELICYRRYGHNEGDEPAFTQPKMYQQIAGRPSLNRIYADALAGDNGIGAETLEALERKVSEGLEASFTKQPVEELPGFNDQWNTISSKFIEDAVDTSVPLDKLMIIAGKLITLPSDFKPHAKINALMQKRFVSINKGDGVDWGNAETLAYATLLDQGYAVRISGQDSRRGTFNHRHCVLTDSQNESSYVPLEAVARDGAYFQAWNSLLSEFGVLGFEYGYSLENPNALTVWEAQFGDFANGAQVIIDQFICCGESKWNRASGLVMLLPHGYEGQGAEHSSARVERFLQLCANNNMIVANPSTPAQMFHLLRRQMLQKFRKPLVVFTPKSLLRHPVCTSTVSELCSGMFQSVIVSSGSLSSARRVLFCSGKICYELEEARTGKMHHDTAIVRFEQLYPLAPGLIRNITDQCANGCQFTWVQEEPENMGAWHYMERKFKDAGIVVNYIGRSEDSCPAVGSHHLHASQQSEIIAAAFLA